MKVTLKPTNFYLSVSELSESLDKILRETSDPLLSSPLAEAKRKKSKNSSSSSSKKDHRRNSKNSSDYLQNIPTEDVMDRWAILSQVGLK